MSVEKDEQQGEVTRHADAIRCCLVLADRGIAGMCDNYRYGIAISHAYQARLLVHGCVHARFYTRPRELVSQLGARCAATLHSLPLFRF